VREFRILQAKILDFRPCWLPVRGGQAVVSERIARTHLRGINAKLNAGNRTQAVAFAQRLGVIR